MKMRNFLLISVLFVFAAGVVFAGDGDGKAKEQKDEKKEELKLKDLFPEKSLFGPSAYYMAFSEDGRYGAYLYKTYKERRHGNDLFIYDTETGRVKRITWPSVMQEFQKSSRKVVEDRKEKAEKDKPKKDADKKDEGKDKKEEEKDSDEKGKDKKKKESLPDEESKTDDKKQDCKKDTEKKEDGKCDKDVEKKDCEKKVEDCKKAGEKKDDAVKCEKEKSGFDKKEQVEKQDCDKKVEIKEEDVDGCEAEKKCDKDSVEVDAEEELKNRGDWVSDKDADDEKAPKYSGINRFKWSPIANEILFDSEGDIYRYKVCGEITRLTHSRDRESGFDWLKCGGGYTFRRGESLIQVVFGRDVSRQLDPKFPNGDKMERSRISPDGKKIAFLTSKETKASVSSKVEIANYRDRLMKSKEVTRHVSDDSLPVHEKRIYIYDLSEAGDEKDTLSEVFKFETKMPDDTCKSPVWSPDSKRIAFMTFEQDPALIKIYEAKVFEEKEEKAVEKEKDKKEAGDKKEDDKDDEKKEDGKKEDDDKKEDEKKADKAKEVYRFLHHGGPNTPRMMELYYLADNKRIVYLSEQSGFRHLNVLDPVYENYTPLTKGHFEVYPIDISKDRKWVFVHATKEHPSQTDVYKVSTKTGKMIRLTKETGTHSGAAVSQDGTKVLTNLVSYGQVKELFYVDSKAKVHKAITDSHPEKAIEFAKHRPEFFDYTNRHGHKLYGMLYKPDDWSKGDDRPVLIYFYGGPLGTRKMVVNGSYSSYNYAFPYYMAKKHGYVACTIDTRGNSGYAGVFEKANFGQIGKPQVEDLVDGVKFLVDNFGVDKEKVAIHGWSFGGFQTQMCMYTEPDVFQVGIAGAGPTEWENYNSWYTRHTIGKSEPGKATLKEFSLLPLAKNLKGQLLLVHGMEDSNVLYQDTVRVYRELLKAGKEMLVELFLDPTGGHGLGGDVKTLGRYRKYEQFLLRTIGRVEEKEEAKEAEKKTEGKAKKKKQVEKKEASKKSK